MSETKPLIGFIGQGWIGKNYATDFEARGYSTVRYALEEPYIQNKDKIKDCDIVFIAVPTPSTPEGFNANIVESAVSLVGSGKTAVIKSTLLPGTTDAIQAKYPDRFVMHSPEFLTEATAEYDAAHPTRNIIGMPIDNSEYRSRAQSVLAILPDAPYKLICSAREAEYIKYGGNNWFYFKVLFINMLYDLTANDGCSWDVIKTAMAADPRIGSTHLNPVHASGEKGGDVRALKFNELHLEPIHKSGRGAGGHCFIKDFAAFSRLYQETFPDDTLGANLLHSMECKNIDLLTKSNKDLDLLKGVYGEDPGALCAS
ncbi:MAG: hypothetical protein JWM46_300 [Candidatus Kaiserbacteria bacterium]|nr:hypothetical protein [Candidatus Kaiserbacteria bacterium]